MKRLALVLALALAACGKSDRPAPARDAAPAKPADARPPPREALVRRAQCALVPPRALGDEEQIRELVVPTASGTLSQPLHLAAGGYICAMSLTRTASPEALPPLFTDPDFETLPEVRRLLPPHAGSDGLHLFVIRDDGWERDLKELDARLDALSGARRKAACAEIADRRPPTAAPLRPRAESAMAGFVETGEKPVLVNDAGQMNDAERWVDTVRATCGF